MARTKKFEDSTNRQVYVKTYKALGAFDFALRRLVKLRSSGKMTMIDGYGWTRTDEHALDGVLKVLVERVYDRFGGRLIEIFVQVFPINSNIPLYSEKITYKEKS